MVEETVTDAEGSAEQVVDSEKVVGNLTVAEFTLLMAELLPARRTARRPSGPQAMPAEAPEGYTMSIAEASAVLGVGLMPVRSLCRDGKLGDGAAVKVGIRWCIRPEAVEAYAAGKADRVAAKAAIKAAKAAAKAGEGADVAEVEDGEFDLDELDLDAEEIDLSGVVAE